MLTMVNQAIQQALQKDLDIATVKAAYVEDELKKIVAMAKSSDKDVNTKAKRDLRNLVEDVHYPIVNSIAFAFAFNDFAFNHEITKRLGRVGIKVFYDEIANNNLGAWAFDASALQAACDGSATDTVAPGMTTMDLALDWIGAWERVMNVFNDEVQRRKNEAERKRKGKAPARPEDIEKDDEKDDEEGEQDDEDALDQLKGKLKKNKNKHLKRPRDESDEEADYDSDADSLVFPVDGDRKGSSRGRGSGALGELETEGRRIKGERRVRMCREFVDITVHTCLV